MGPSRQNLGAEGQAYLHELQEDTQTLQSWLSMC